MRPLLLVLALLAATACSSSPPPESQQVLQDWIDNASSGRHTANYDDLLHPEYHEFIDRSDFASCFGDAPTGITVEVTDEYPDTMRPPGLDDEREVTASVFTATMNGQSDTDTGHIEHTADGPKVFLGRETLDRIERCAD